MYFFLHVLPEVVSAVFSFLVEWFLFHAVRRDTVSPRDCMALYGHDAGRVASPDFL